MNKMRSAIGVALVALSLGSIVVQAAPELVTNGGFETNPGSWSVPTGWTGGLYTFATKPADAAISSTHGGSFVAGFSAQNSLDYLTQAILPTAAGQAYTFSFWLTNTAFYLDSKGLGGVNEFTAAWNGVTVFDQTDIAAGGWRQYSFNVVATGPSTTISFGGRNKPGYFGLDDVSVQAVTAVPEPGVLGMMLTGLAGIGLLAGRRKSQRA